MSSKLPPPCTEWFELLIANGFNEKIAVGLIELAQYSKTTQFNTWQVRRVKSIGPVKIAKLQELGIVESVEDEWERTIGKPRREKINELEAELTKAKLWKAAAIQQADKKIARLRKKLAQLKSIKSE